MKYKVLSWINDFWYSHLRILASLILYCLARLCVTLNRYDLGRKLCARSLRYGLRQSAIKLYKEILDVYPYAIENVSTGISIDEASLRSIVVKWPSYENDAIDKGVIIVTFTKTFSFYVRSINLSELEKHFTLVLEPSWSGYADPDIFFFYKKYKSVLVSCSEMEDRVLLNCFRETFVPVAFGASDWVDYKVFKPEKSEKIYDSIYVANTNPIKRVKRYLDAIRNIVSEGATNYKGLLVCASWGRGETLVKELVRQSGLENNIELKFSLGRDELIQNLCKSKVNVLLSYKEGSNRSLFESMFCDVPVICLSENIGVNKSYINDCTGLLVPDKFLEWALVWASRNAHNLKPRDWAINNISPEISTLKLMASLGLDSQHKMFIKTNNPEVSYFEYPNVNHKEYSRSLLELFGKEASSINTYSDKVERIKEKFITEIAS